MQGAESYIGQAREAKTKRSLEEYRAEKQMELEKYKQGFDSSRDDKKIAATASEGLLDRAADADKTAADNTSRETVAGMRAADLKKDEGTMKALRQANIEKLDASIKQEFSAIDGQIGYATANDDPKAGAKDLIQKRLDKAVSSKASQTIINQLKLMLETYGSIQARMNELEAQGITDYGQWQSLVPDAAKREPAAATETPEQKKARLEAKYG